MVRYSLSLPTDYEVPALLSAGGSFLAKGGHAVGAIGIILFLCVLYLAAQCARHGACSLSIRSVTAAEPMIKASASITCVATAAATMIIAAALMSGRADADPDLLIKAQTKSVDRPIGISLRQIEYCLNKDRKNDKVALNVTFAGLDSKCPIEQGEI